MTRQTSIDAYNLIVASGSITGRRLEVYNIIYNGGSLTAAEIGKAMGSYTTALHTAIRNIHARLTELRDMGAIYEKSLRVCTVTGKTVIEWAITGDMPQKLPKRKTKTQIINELTAKVLALETKLNSLGA
jgi:hypothetical protein